MLLPCKDRSWSAQYLSLFPFSGYRENSFFFVIPHVYFSKPVLHFRSLFSLYFLTNHCTFPICHYSRLCEATFNHLSHQCLFLASFTNCRKAPLLLCPFVSIFPLSLCHWIVSHYLSLLHAQGPQMCHFNHSPVTRASPRDKDWQAMTSSLPSLTCLYQHSPYLSHMALCPRLPCNPLLQPWRTSKEHMYCWYKSAW